MGKSRWKRRLLTCIIVNCGLNNKHHYCCCLCVCCCPDKHGSALVIGNDRSASWTSSGYKYFLSFVFITGWIDSSDCEVTNLMYRCLPCSPHCLAALMLELSLMRSSRFRCFDSCLYSTPFCFLIKASDRLACQVGSSGWRERERDHRLATNVFILPAGQKSTVSIT